MNNKKKDLGRGIRALLDGIEEDLAVKTPVYNTNSKYNSDSDSEFVSSTAEIPLASIEVNPFQPRADFDEQALRELSESITVHGVIQPITVRQLSPGKFQLIAGERRLRASQLAGLQAIPAFIRQANDQEMLEMALIENIQRENLNAMEIAINYQRLIDECDLTQEQLGNRLGKERTTVTNYLRLLKLPPEIQHGIKNKLIQMGHARAIISIDDVGFQLELYKEIVKNGLSVRKVEDIVRSYNLNGKKATAPSGEKKKKSLPPSFQKVQDQLSSYFSTKVSINRKKGNEGDIVISYFSDDDLNRILEILENN